MVLRAFSNAILLCTREACERTAISVPVRLWVCLYARIYQNQSRHVQTSPTFYTLPVAVARSSSEDNAVCYARPVLWMALFSHRLMGKRETGHWRIIHRDSPDGAAKLRARGRSLPSPIAYCSH